MNSHFDFDSVPDKIFRLPINHDILPTGTYKAVQIKMDFFKNNDFVYK